MRRVRALAAIAALTEACAQIEGLSHYSFDSVAPRDSGTSGDSPDGAAADGLTTLADGAPAEPPPNLCGDTSGVLVNAPWPLVYGCPTNSGRSSFHGPGTGATALPPFGTIGDKRGAIVNGSGVVFLEESGEGDVYAFDLATGDQKWKAQTRGSGFNPVTALVIGP